MSASVNDANYRKPNSFITPMTRDMGRNMLPAVKTENFRVLLPLVVSWLMCLVYDKSSDLTPRYLPFFVDWRVRPNNIRDWNALPDSLISFAEMSAGCVSKFTSLVRARD